jgi:hypothetical protein
MAPPKSFPKTSPLHQGTLRNSTFQEATLAQITVWRWINPFQPQPEHLIVLIVASRHIRGLLQVFTALLQAVLELF